MNALFRYSSLIAALLVAGCASQSQPKEEPVHQQGWIGGQYKRAIDHLTASDWLFGNDKTIVCFPPGLERVASSGILTVALPTNSPAYQAGLREGDLILDVARQPAPDLPAFWKAVHAARPGSSIPVRAYREGKTMDFEVTAGRETYRHQGTLMVGIPGIWEGLHLIPTHDAPSFSLGPVGWEREEGAPDDLDSVEQRYRRSCHPKDKQQTSAEEWRCWLAIFQVTKGRSILAQAPFAAGATNLTKAKR